MIVRARGSSLLLITQPDHAALAARIMREWRAGGLPDAAERSAILLAVEQHDNGWREADASPIVEPVTGRILDFISAPDAVRREVWPRGVARLADTPYAAALVAQHALTIYQRYRADAAWLPFFGEMEALRDEHLRRAGRVPDGLARDYLFVRGGDLLSLTFCTGRAQPAEADLPFALRLEPGRIVVTPDPFEGRTIPFEIAARELPDRAYRSNADAASAFSGAPQVTLRGMASGSPS